MEGPTVILSCNFWPSLFFFSFSFFIGFGVCVSSSSFFSFSFHTRWLLLLPSLRAVSRFLFFFFSFLLLLLLLDSIFNSSFFLFFYLLLCTGPHATKYDFISFIFFFFLEIFVYKYETWYLIIINRHCIWIWNLIITIFIIIVFYMELLYNYGNY